MNNIIPSEASAKQEAFKKENIQLKIQVKKLKAQVCSLQEELHTLDDGVERLPLVRFIEYAEMYPPEQNEYARTVKELLRDVYTSFSNEERARLRALGHKPLHAADLVARSATPAERHAASLPDELDTPPGARPAGQAGASRTGGRAVATRRAEPGETGRAGLPDQRAAGHRPHMGDIRRALGNISRRAAHQVQRRHEPETDERIYITANQHLTIARTRYAYRVRIR